MATKEEMLKAINKDVEKAKKSGMKPTKIENRNPYPAKATPGRKSKR